MWSGLEKISEQVTSYSTLFGKLWYLCVFVFRMIVVVTIGTSVYSDEQSAFRCSTKVIGCDNVCYDRFSKISHIRFWAFQLLAVASPAVLFHFFSSHINASIEKLNNADKVPEQGMEGVDSVFGRYEDSEAANFDREKMQQRIKKEQKKMRVRRKSVGKIKQKKVFVNNRLVDLSLTRSIHVAYYCNVVARVTIEVVSLYFAYVLFHFTDYTVSDSVPLDFILIRVPQVFRCDGENVKWACGQHMSLGERTGYVPCWVSRPWEKTIFMCYMNILSALSLVFSVVELIHLTVRSFSKKSLKRFYGKKKRVIFSSNQPVENGDISRKESEKTNEKKFNDNKSAILVPLSDIIQKVNTDGKFALKKLRKKKLLKSIAIRMTDDNELDESTGSNGYHSSEYETEESESMSIASVSIRESN